jgi:REP element-mobilizing transposase RayT
VILANHLILSAYGFWLPNDPRGSWSAFVGAWELFRHAGKATKVTGTRSYAHDPHDRALRLSTKKRLKHPPVRFTGKQALCIATGFHRASIDGKYPIHALAILPDHVHLVLGRLDRPIGRVVGHLKFAATAALRAAGLHPFGSRGADSDPSCWAAKHWTVLIDNPAHLRSAIRYVEDNPIKEGLRRQRWSFVRPYPF